MEISSPATGNVQRQQVVNGFIRPPGPVQVLVLSADNKWRLQSEVILDGPFGTDGAFWSATCDFGPPGGYSIVAIAGCGILGRVLEEIPNGLTSSQVVQVQIAPRQGRGADDRVLSSVLAAS